MTWLNSPDCQLRAAGLSGSKRDCDEAVKEKVPASVRAIAGSEGGDCLTYWCVCMQIPSDCLRPTGVSVTSCTATVLLERQLLPGAGVSVARPVNRLSRRSIAALVLLLNVVFSTMCTA